MNVGVKKMILEEEGGLEARGDEAGVKHPTMRDGAGGDACCH